MGLLCGCALTRDPIQSASQSSSKTSEPISKKHDYSGEWEALNQQVIELSGHVCYQQTYRFKIDSLGNIYHLGTDENENLPRAGWIEPNPTRTQRLFFENERHTYLFKQRNPSYFKLIRNKYRSPDEMHEEFPIADPEIYPERKTDSPSIECDTEIWRFYRIPNE